MITRLIMAAIILFALWVLYKRAKKLWAEMQRQSGAQHSPTQIRMLQCRHCGMHIPENEAVYDGKDTYCCPQHKQAGRSA